LDVDLRQGIIVYSDYIFYPLEPDFGFGVKNSLGALGRKACEHGSIDTLFLRKNGVEFRI